MSFPSPSRPALAAMAVRAGLLFVLGCADAGAQAPPGAEGPVPDGTYRVAFAGQTLALVLRTGDGGQVRGRLTGLSVAFELEGVREVDDEGEVSVEGVMAGGGAAGLVSLFPDEDGDFGLLVTPLGPDGAPASEQAAMYYATWESPATAALDEGLAGTAAWDGGAGDGRSGSVPGALAGHPLVGRWATQVVMSSEVGSVATEMSMEFRPDGTLVDLGSRSIGGIPGVGGDTGFEPGGDQGLWRTEGDVIVVSYGGSPWVPFARFRVDGTRLGLTYLQDGSVQVWHRQGG